jgi:membrane-associated phospholipid phosphatase
MIIIGALIQLTFPARAPWPTDFDSVQRFIHDLFSLRPYACLPSMHVALSILPACIGLVTLHSRLLKTLSVFIALLITASTLTMKEHYFLDALTGVVLGVLTAILWFLGTGYAIKRSFKKGDQIWKPKIPLRMTE